MRKILFNLSAVIFSVTAFGQWIPNTATNNVIVNTSTSTTKTSMVAVSDGAGGMFIGWIDSRIAGSQSIYVQRILASGAKQFANEVEVTSSPNVGGGTSVSKSNLSMVADGSGGVICVWQDPRNTTTSSSNNDIYGQRISATGTVLWTAGGIRMTVADNTVSSKTIPVIEVVNTTEAILVYGDNRLGNVDLYAQKILISTGATQWASEVSLHGAQANTQNNHALLADGSGGVFVVYQDPRLATSNIDIYAQRIDNTGAMLWGASATAIANGANNQLTPQLVSDGAGGFVATWSDARVSSTDFNIYAQRVNSSGVAQWTAGGELINNSANGQTNPLIIRSGSNYIISWSDNRVATTGDRNIYAQCINNSGALQWTPVGGTAVEGIPIVTATGNQPSNVGSGAVMLDDGTGSAVIIWEDARVSSSALDLFAQKINTTGAVQWAANGVLICSATGNQNGPVAVQSASNTIVTAWRDSRTASNGEIYASRIETSGVLPLQSITLQATLRNEAVDIRWNTIQELNTALYVLEKSANGIDFSPVTSSRAMGTGNGSYGYNDNKIFRGKMYYRIKCIDLNGVYTYSSIAVVESTRSVQPGIAVFPNPVKSNVTLQVTGFATGNIVVSIMDAAGSVHMRRSIQLLNAFQAVQLPVSVLSPGVYTVHVQNAHGEIATSRIVKQ